MELVGFSPFSHVRASAYPQPRRRAAGPGAACDPAVMTWHEIERAQLAQALLDVAPDAPTLCEGWQARHLAAHVVLRERSPMVGAGIAVPALSARAEAAIARLADQAVDRGRLPGPGGAGRRQARALAPGLLGRGVRERRRVLRAHRGRPARSRPGPGPRARRRSSSTRCGRTCRAPPPDGCARSPSASCSSATTASGTTCATPKADYGTVVVRGDAGEIVLYLLGRGAAADVRVEGQADDVATIEAVLPSR